MSSRPGTVYLVGAGPGDPGLITLRAADLLAEADLVLYDGLVNPLLLRLATGECERTARTRSGNSAIVRQDEINRRLIAEARAGRTVVRLKGGDPYIFGRGGEEAAALREAGIPFEVVPGITAATAAGAYAGFSWTHRETSSAVAFVTGHETPERPGSQLDFDALARFPGTLVFYMGLARLRAICDQLIECGKSPDTPAAVIAQATLAAQRTVQSTLAQLPEDVEVAQLKAPSLIVVGDCVRQREGRSWFESLPLAGLRVGVTRSIHQADAVVEQIVRQGGQPVLMPMIDIRPVDGDDAKRRDAAIGRLKEFDWLIFTSANGVRSFFERIWELGLDARCVGQLRIAVVGQATADELAIWSLRPDVMPESANADDLASVLADPVKGQCCLWPCADRARPTLGDALREAGATVEALPVYRHVDTDLDEMLRRELVERPPDWIGLSSPAIARRTAALFPNWQASTSVRFASISPLTSQAAADAGLQVSVEARESGWPGILQAIADGR